MARALDLPPITIDLDLLDRTESRRPFDDLAWLLLARAGMLTEQLADSVRRSTPDGVDLDHAVLGGLLVRLWKLMRGVFESTQAEASEAHLVLGRSAAETAVTLLWLNRFGTAESFRRFRADSFAHYRIQLEAMVAGDDEDETLRELRERVRRHAEHELAAAEITWEDVPRRANSWGPNMRQRCEQLKIAWVYNPFFASHSSYVHPSWHEVRTFHLDVEGTTARLSETFGAMSPTAAYVLAQVVTEAAASVTYALPNDLDADDVAERVGDTVKACRHVSFLCSKFMARGGVDDALRA